MKRQWRIEGRGIMIPSSSRDAKVLVSLSVVPHVLEGIKVEQVNRFQIEN